MPVAWHEIKSRALTFSRTWADAATDDSAGKQFWIDFFAIFGVTDKRVAAFENAAKKLPASNDVQAQRDGFVALFWPGMLLVEQTSRGKNLEAALAQALSYVPGMTERDLPQVILVCDFARVRVHRLAANETSEFELQDLHKNVKLFGFVAGYKAQSLAQQNPINIEAAERMGKLHDALKASGYTGHALEVLLVRLLFCLFADDTGIFQPAQALRTFIEERSAQDGSDLGARLTHLFQTLNTAEDKRSKALDEQLAAFPYVKGKLFADSWPMADFNAAMREALVDACALDWSAVCPAIFGSLFQTIMDNKSRRNLGAHYTSEENILKLIRPLFLDELWAEFETIKSHTRKLHEFHKKLCSLTFLDPACGCGNFLVISYRELRKLEFAVLRVSSPLGQHTLDGNPLIGINVDQFYGIEIEEFPAQIAQVALWLIDHQMNLRGIEEFGLCFARIPLKTTPRVVHGNALQLDWNVVLPAEQCSFVLGNPPFIGAKFMGNAQRADTRTVFRDIEHAGLLDFVAGWYVKAAKYIALPEAATEAPRARCAFVSTNSITQGEQVGVLWSWLLAQGIHIHFAHRTFSWTNEARGNAAVHCVIIGFGLEDRPGKVIYEYDAIRGEPHPVQAANINPYLVDAPNVVLPRRSLPICAAPLIGIGNKPIDDGNYLFTTEERDAFIALEPASAKWFRRWLGAVEFINGYERWCLWLGDCSRSELRAMPEAIKRVQAVKTARLASRSAPTQKLASTPTRFHVEFMPRQPYMVIPEVSSERRRYIPLDYVQPATLASNKLRLLPDATLWQFGVLHSAMHVAWTRYTCGRMKSDLQYSISIVYNNFPWPDLTQGSEPDPAAAPAHHARAAIEHAAQAVLDARVQCQSGAKPASLADLYDPLSMPPVLLKAHQKLDVAVDAAYALSGGKKTWKNDADRVAYLFELYQRYTSLLPASGTKPKRKTKA